MSDPRIPILPLFRVLCPGSLTQSNKMHTFVNQQILIGLDDIALSAYSAFALVFLPTANLSKILGGLEELAGFVNVTYLSEAIIRAAASTALFAVEAELRLWLLAHFINLHRLNRGVSQEPGYMRAISILLSSSASEIVDRIDIEDMDGLQQAGEEDDEGHAFLLPLPRFVKDELITLVDKQSITGLLAKFSK